MAATPALCSHRDPRMVACDGFRSGDKSVPHEERPWEAKPEADGDMSRAVGCAIGMAFLLVQLGALTVVGFTTQGLLIGLGLGVVVIVVLAKVMAASRRGPRPKGPPPDLL